MTTTHQWLPPGPGSLEWQPALLKVPSALRRVVAEWLPALVRGYSLTTFGVLSLFLVLQFLIPARLVISGMGAAGRPSAAIGVLLAFLWALSALRKNQLPRGRQPIRWIVGLFAGVELIGYAIGFDRLPHPIEASAANRWMIFVISIVGVMLAVADGVLTRANLDRLLRLLVVLVAMMSIVGILQFLRLIDLTQYIQIPGLQQNSALLGVGDRGDADLARVAGTANHYIEFGVVLALVLPIALHYALFSPPGRSRIWRWVQVVIIGFGIPLSISRSATLTIILAIGLLAVVWPWRMRYNALVIGILSLMAFRIVSPGVLGTIKALFTNASNDTSVTDRIARTGYVVELWELRPWFGRGAGMVIPEQYILLDNQWYMTLLAGGVVGVLALSIFFFVPYFIGRSVRLRGRDQETRHLGQALAVTMPAAVLSAGTFDAFSFTTWVGVMCVLIGAVGALWRLDGTHLSRPLQVAQIGDRYVTTPLTANLRERVRQAVADTRPSP